MDDQLRNALDDFYKQAADAQAESEPGAALIGWKPIASDALKVHPKQIPEAIEDAKKKGVPTEFLPDGRPILRTRQHRKEYIKAYQFHDNDGGYADG